MSRVIVLVEVWLTEEQKRPLRVHLLHLRTPNDRLLLWKLLLWKLNSSLRITAVNKTHLMSDFRPYLRDLKALLSGWVTSPVVSQKPQKEQHKANPLRFLWAAFLRPSPPHFQTMIHYAQRGSCFDLPELRWKRFCAREITAGCPNYSQMGTQQRSAGGSVTSETARARGAWRTRSRM